MASRKNPLTRRSTNADHYAKGAAEFTAGVAQEPTYSKIDE
jgi:hypothetical protein